ncbi:hypothetical protein [[Flexibacter] sp. ATCC 35208]|uniref:hypothetical protein n=1 Tax=[Flexibacter] sp. ATCC 35208 TaxID=1936242 RepID=UPI0009CF0E06|nr:hypothetical protein [[Flexibacter] sp. ATCC 35208]OMP81194.1 hypothetical protein BW716_01015 [[Flexibacter] sp. ATCC 35208]
MRFSLICSLLSILFFANTFAATPKPAVATTYNVRIELVDIYGNPYTGSTGLYGFWAINQSTGVTYNAARESYEIYDLPAGTYQFGANPGNWDGVVSQTVTLSDSQVGSDGYIVVTLTYWVE